jgi:hypothetical protein
MAVPERKCVRAQKRFAAGVFAIHVEPWEKGNIGNVGTGNRWKPLKQRLWQVSVKVIIR